MRQRKISIRKDQQEFLQGRDSLSLAPMLRSAVDELMDGDRDIPDNTRRTDVEVVKTVVLLREEQIKFLQEAEMNFSAFASQVVDERIEIERKIQELDE